MMRNELIIIFIAGLLVFTFFIFTLYLVKLNKDSRKTKEGITGRFLKLPIDTNLKKSRHPENWEASIKKSAENLKKSYDTLVLLHGTFAGDDIFGLESFVTGKKRVRKAIFSPIKKISRKSSYYFAKDLGRFTKNYQRVLEKYFFPIEISEFNWGSENNNAGRFKGAVKLIEHLVLLSDKKKNSKFLLIGHSHAGQVFALLTQFIHGKDPRPLIDICEGYNLGPHITPKNLKKLSTLKIDFVTLGSPVRFNWEKGPYKALHIVNHRSTQYTGLGMRGAGSNKYGDYFQMWGTMGSDFTPISKEDRKLAKKVTDTVGDRPYGKLTWLKELTKGKRIHPNGLTILVDFEDKRKIPFTGYRNLFGHGVYTSYENSAILFRLISLNLKNADY